MHILCANLILLGLSLIKCKNIIGLPEQNSKQKESITCEIYFSKKKGKGWTSPVLLPLPYDSISTFGHPCISPDGKFLYFASDMPGGQGGKDIWMMKKVKRDEWSTPINLGDQINTPGDELYPFIHPNGDLYFASNGHIGMGGMDIFKADFDDDGTLISVSNMKSPINSSTDDFGIIFEEKFERGYFTSNRPGGKGGDDIYQFNFPQLKLSLKGVVTEPGVDGGISFEGLTASFLSSVSISMLAYAGFLVLIEESHAFSASIEINYLFISVFFGFFGSVCDSFLGATLQSRDILSNNGVNLASISISVLLSLVFLGLF